jgi:hypothetical protein
MKPEICSKDVEMSDVALAADLIRQVAGPRGCDEPVKTLWERAYSHLSRANGDWTRRRVRALWEREAARIEYREIKEMAAAIAAQEALRDARAEHAAHVERIARLEALLVHTDEDFHSDQIRALRDQGERVARS